MENLVEEFRLAWNVGLHHVSYKTLAIAIHFNLLTPEEPLKKKE